MDVDSIYQSMKLTFKQKSGYDVQNDSDLGIRMQVFAGELEGVFQKIQTCEKQLFPQTATGIYLERHGQCRDIQKKQAQAASGQLKFSRTTPASSDIVIPAGTLCTSKTGGGMMYITQYDGVIARGTTSSLIEAVAQKQGLDGNILAGKIDTLVSIIAGVESVNNPQNFSGGREKEPDEVFRKRLLQSYLNVSNGANLKFYEDFALKHPNITSAKAVFEGTGNQLSIYVTDFFRMIDQQVLKEIEQDIQEARELNMKIVVKAPQVIQLDVDFTVYIRTFQNYSSKIFQSEDYIMTQMYHLGVGESFNPYAIGIGLQTSLLGVENLSFEQPQTVRAVQPHQIISPGMITVTLKKS